MNRVPIAAPGRISPEEKCAVVDAMTRVLDSGRWILGREVAAFEQEFAGSTGARHVVGVGNGTDALALALLALRLPAGSDVLVTANDGGFSAVAARMVGLNPVAMDVDPVTFDPTDATAAASWTPNTLAIIVTHLHGNAVDLTGLDEWRRSKGLRLIEDCAQAHGLRVHGRHVGSSGDAATFSFYPTKNLGAVGDGGAVAVAGPESEALSDRVRTLRQYGWDEDRRVAVHGGRNSRLDEIQAAILRARLPFLEARNLRRRQMRDTYQDVLSGSARASILGEGVPSVAHHAVVLTRSGDERDELARHLDHHGIDTASHYPWPLADMPGLQLEAGAPTPVTRALIERSISVPCCPELLDEEVKRVADALGTWCAR